MGRKKFLNDEHSMYRVSDEDLVLRYFPSCNFEGL